MRWICFSLESVFTGESRLESLNWKVFRRFCVSRLKKLAEEASSVSQDVLERRPDSLSLKRVEYADDRPPYYADAVSDLVVVIGEKRSLHTNSDDLRPLTNEELKF